MNKELSLTQWIEASAEAFSDFVAQTFFIEEFIAPHCHEFIPKEELNNLNGLSGASIRLNLSNNNQYIDVFILAKKMVLADIASRILLINGDELIDSSDVNDAIKEIANVIAGGVKCRLNSEFERAEIIFNLPVYIEEFEINNKLPTTAVRLYIHNNEEIILMVSIGFVA